MMDSPRIDWESILRRTRMAADEALSEAELQRVFAERAEQLAHRSQEDATERGQELFRFTLGRAALAIELDFVRTIVLPKWTTEIPGAPAHLSRVAHLAGRLVSLCRLDLVLGIGRLEQEPTKYLLLEYQGLRLGVAATSLLGVAEMDLSGLSAPGQTAGSELIRGIARDMTLVLDGPRLVTELRMTPSAQNGDE